jgi:hypothetical protein
MQTKKTLAALLLAAFTTSSGLMAQNVLSRGQNLNLLVAGSPDVLRVQNGLLAHDGAPLNALPTGNPSNVGTFGPTAKWIGIGAPAIPGNPVYGERTQWNGQSYIKALRERTPGGIKDALLEWGNQAGSEMQFRFITNPASSTGFTRIQTLTDAGNSYFGTTPPAGFYGTPRLGSNTANQCGFTSTTTNNNSGMFQTAVNTNGAFGIGVFGYTSSSSTNNFNYGAVGFAVGSGLNNRNYGVYAVASGVNTGINYGIYANAPTAPNAGLTTNTSYAGFFQGDVYCTGTYFGSDEKFKRNVEPEKGALDKVLKVNPVSYFYDTDKYAPLNFTDRPQHGFIAQQLQEVFPEVVQTARFSIPGDDGTEKGSETGLAVNYAGLISILFSAIQEQQQQIRELQAKPVAGVNTPLTPGAATGTSAVNETPAAVNGRIVTASGEYSAADFKLQQNSPNPFSTTTAIRYSLPANVNNAFIGVYNLQGTQLMLFNRLSGTSQVTISANTLKPGIYIYALVADGQEIMSRKMVVSQ